MRNGTGLDEALLEALVERCAAVSRPALFRGHDSQVGAAIRDAREGTRKLIRTALRIAAPVLINEERARMVARLDALHDRVEAEHCRAVVSAAADIISGVPDNGDLRHRVRGVATPPATV